MSLEEFSTRGFVILRSVIPSEWVSLALKIGNEIYPDHMAKFAQPKDFGSTHHWKTMDMYSTQYLELFQMMTSDLMAGIVREYLGPEAYLFNDQFVIKQPMEDYPFPWHFDNFYTSDPKGEFEGRYQAITTCWFLTPNNIDCGGLRFLALDKTSKKDFEIKDPNIENTETIDAQPGDVGIWTGNTLHSSEGNGSDFQRSIWLQVYSSIPLGKGWRSGYYDKQFLRNGEIAL